jgi:hypothetical protein
MLDAPGVRIGEAGCNLNRITDHFREWQRSLGDPIGQRPAFDEFHHEVIDALFMTHVEDRADSRMVELGGEPRLAFKSAPHLRVASVSRSDHLNRDDSPEPRVAGSIHFAHPTGPGRSNDFVRTQARSRAERHQRSGSRIDFMSRVRIKRWR